MLDAARRRLGLGFVVDVLGVALHFNYLLDNGLFWGCPRFGLLASMASRGVPRGGSSCHERWRRLWTPGAGRVAEPKVKGSATVFGLPRLYAASLPIAAESGESMAELAAEPGQAGLPSRAQAEDHYDEAVAVAVAACAADTAGQRCYICFGEGDEDEGLVRMCACRGTGGYAHLSCLVRQAEMATSDPAEKTGASVIDTLANSKIRFDSVKRMTQIQNTS